MQLHVAKDLTREVPRSPYEELDGIPWLARLIDKLRAMLAGTLGEYIPYPCGGDRGFLATVGIEPDALRETIASGASRTTGRASAAPWPPRTPNISPGPGLRWQLRVPTSICRRSTTSRSSSVPRRGTRSPETCRQRKRAIAPVSCRHDWNPSCAGQPSATSAMTGAWAGISSSERTCSGTKPSIGDVASPNDSASSNR